MPGKINRQYQLFEHHNSNCLYKLCNWMLVLWFAEGEGWSTCSIDFMVLLRSILSLLRYFPDIVVHLFFRFLSRTPKYTFWNFPQICTLSRSSILFNGSYDTWVYKQFQKYLFLTSCSLAFFVFSKYCKKTQFWNIGSILKVLSQSVSVFCSSIILFSSMALKLPHYKSVFFFQKFWKWCWWINMSVSRPKFITIYLFHPIPWFNVDHVEL